MENVPLVNKTAAFPSKGEAIFRFLKKSPEYSGRATHHFSSGSLHLIQENDPGSPSFFAFQQGYFQFVL